jgi:hypothetical protein
LELFGGVGLGQFALQLREPCTDVVMPSNEQGQGLLEWLSQRARNAQSFSNANGNSSGQPGEDSLAEARFSILLKHLDGIDRRLESIEGRLAGSGAAAAASTGTGCQHADKISGPQKRIDPDTDTSLTMDHIDNGSAYHLLARSQLAQSLGNKRDSMDALVSHLEARQARHELREAVVSQNCCHPVLDLGSEIVAECVAHVPRLHPKGTVRFRWELLNLAMLCVCVLITPIRLAFASEHEHVPTAHTTHDLSLQVCAH